VVQEFKGNVPGDESCYWAINILYECFLCPGIFKYIFWLPSSYKPSRKKEERKLFRKLLIPGAETEKKTTKRNGSDP
jgi:hypothetical protein